MVNEYKGKGEAAVVAHKPAFFRKDFGKPRKTSFWVLRSSFQNISHTPCRSVHPIDKKCQGAIRSP